MTEMSQASASTQATVDPRPVYEVGFHLLPSIPEEGLIAAVEKIRAALGGVEIISQGFPVKTTLAYTIERGSAPREKFTSSYFGWVKFVVEERSSIPAIQDALRAMSDVIRYIVIETTREDMSQGARRAVFASDRLEGTTLEKKTEAEKGGEVSQEELDKSIDALTA